MTKTTSTIARKRCTRDTKSKPYDDVVPVTTTLGSRRRNSTSTRSRMRIRKTAFVVFTITVFLLLGVGFVLGTNSVSSSYTSYTSTNQQRRNKQHRRQRQRRGMLLSSSSENNNNSDSSQWEIEEIEQEQQDQDQGDLPSADFSPEDYYDDYSSTTTTPPTNYYYYENDYDYEYDGDDYSTTSPKTKDPSSPWKDPPYYYRTSPPTPSPQKIITPKPSPWYRFSDPPTPLPTTNSMPMPMPIMSTSNNPWNDNIDNDNDSTTTATTTTPSSSSQPPPNSSTNNNNDDNSKPPVRVDEVDNSGDAVNDIDAPSSGQPAPSVEQSSPSSKPIPNNASRPSLLPTVLIGPPQPEQQQQQQQQQEEILICKNIEGQNSERIINNDNEINDSTLFSILVSVQYDKLQVTTEELTNYLDLMNIPVSLWVAGCETQAMDYSSDIILTSQRSKKNNRTIRQRQRQRRIEDEESQQQKILGTISYSEVESWKLRSSCDAATPDISCDKFSSRAIIFELDDDGGSIPEEIIRNRIYAALDRFNYLVTDQIGVFFMEINPNDTIIEVGGSNSDNDDGPSPDGINDGTTNNDKNIISSNDTVVIVGSLAAGLASLLLGMVCIFWWRRRSDDVIYKHSRFDDASEDYYQPDIYNHNNDYIIDHHDSIVSTEETVTPSPTNTNNTRRQRVYYRDDDDDDDNNNIDTIDESYITNDENDFVARAIPFDSSREYQGTIGLSTVWSMDDTDESFVDEANISNYNNHNNNDNNGHPFDEPDTTNLQSNWRSQWGHQHRGSDDGIGNDLHQHRACSSPSCRICDSRRQQGIQGRRGEQWLEQIHILDSPDRVPGYDPSRWCINGDIVQL
ncbi:hypothetical protein FRACYDRAFT_251234 [Fragilariopsis cylindrus CCMP1102]|uniref:Uncharacterized protein n=1 Tax=Fragilariopsis cylindrus CCMP1102 TaxID=635003 RepID=A0A1E7EN93_9STRA|nr:hypothetical protein FRACYDRAFT_251234 [Fragilariopsis cylindrus CCMP1102]|eukprot:OEU07429.1 hypothetical protein FRACYDRAFT_251234 [Fragilariopsis cylindrus CCMP1102]